MSDDFEVFPNNGNGDEPDRDPASDGRRALYAVLSVFGFMVLVVAVAIVLLNTKPAISSGEDNVAGPSLAATGSATQVTLRTVDTFATGTHHRAAISIARKPPPSSSASASGSTSGSAVAIVSRTPGQPATTPHSTPTSVNSGPCPSSSPCELVGDAGAISAVQRYRRDSVPGYVTTRAKDCALAQAFGGNCAGSYSYVPESSQNGAKAVADVVALGGSWFGDPSLKQFEVGWSYDPRSGLYYCAFIRN